MNPEYINTSGYLLLVINIFTLLFCFGNSLIWGSMCLYENKKPQYLNYILLMFGVSLVAILANSFALGRMFDSFIIVKMKINKGIIRSTLIDRAAMFVTFGMMALSAIAFSKIKER